MSEDDKKESTEIGEHVSKPISVAEKLGETLKNFDVSTHRSEILEILKDRLVASTAETASIKQKAETMIINKLIENIDTMRPRELLQTLDQISKSNEVAVQSLLGKGNSSEEGRGLGIVINNNAGGGSTPSGNRIDSNAESSDPMTDANFLFEAMSAVAATLQKNNNFLNNEEIEDVDFKEVDDD